MVTPQKSEKRKTTLTKWKSLSKQVKIIPKHWEIALLFQALHLWAPQKSEIHSFGLIFTLFEWFSLTLEWFALILRLIFTFLVTLSLFWRVAWLSPLKLIYFHFSKQCMKRCFNFWLVRVNNKTFSHETCPLLGCRNTCKDILYLSKGWIIHVNSIVYGPVSVYYFYQTWMWFSGFSIILSSLISHADSVV